MNSKIHKNILIWFLTAVSFVSSNPKVGLEIGLGLYGPKMSGFDDNVQVPFPTKKYFHQKFIVKLGFIL